MNSKKLDREISKKSRIYVDFNEMIDLVLLSKYDFKLNSNGENIKMIEGKKIDIYMDDENDKGFKDNLIASGIVERNNSGIFEVAKWCCRIDENGIQHESDIISTLNS